MCEPLVSAGWLKDALKNGVNSNLRVIDASFPMPGQQINMAEEYEKSHVEGATYFSLGKVKDTESKFALMLPSPEVFAEHVSKVHGVSNSTHVVVYDRNAKFGLFSACRLWWMFRVFGHSNVSVVDGGFEKWCSEGGATASGESPSVEAGSFAATFQPQLVQGFSDVAAGLADKSVQLIDARSPGRFNGEAPEPNPKLPSGHMVGAVSIPFFKTLNPETKTMKNADGLREVFTTAGVDISKPLIATCGSGVTACVLAFSAFLSGSKDIPVFDGSWTEFVQTAKPELMENLQFSLEKQ